MESPVAKRRRISVIITFLVLILIAAVVSGWLIYSKKHSSLVPEDVRKSVSFPIYYPDPTKLPRDYILDKNSFSANGEAVIYTVTYGNNKKIIFSVQKKPSDNDLAVFYKNNIPLREEVLTLIGTAEISVLNNREFVSLPTYDGAWIIITAPQDINHDRLIVLVKATTHKAS